MSGALRRILGLVAAAVTAYVVGTALNSQFVIGAHGVPVSFGDRFNMTMFDISNMTLYLVIIAVAMVIGFLIAGGLKRFLPKLSAIAYPIAGAAAIGTALGAMYIMFQTVPISGARSTLGFLSQMLAGGIGGWVFARIGVSKEAARA